MTRIGLLRMCELPAATVQAAGSYHTVFQNFFAGHDVVDFAVHEGATPDSVDDCDVWVISGSPASTYDGHDWIRTGEDIVRELIAAERPTLGICFGHQLMAQALGGRVEKATVGWGAGALTYDVIAAPPWMTDAPASITVLAMHQDQVVEIPDDCSVWATSEHCPIAGVTYGERAWSIQPHPEFTVGIVDALCRDRRARLGADVADAAIASLVLPLDGHLIADATMRVGAVR